MHLEQLSGEEVVGIKYELIFVSTTLEILKNVIGSVPGHPQPSTKFHNNLFGIYNFKKLFVTRFSDACSKQPVSLYT